MRRVMTSLAFALTFAVATANTAVATDLSNADTASIERLSKTMSKDPNYRQQWPKLRCLSFIVENRSKTYADVAVHERHGNGCKGDPNTAPIVDRFRVPANKTQSLLIYDEVEGEYVPYRPAPR
jgi:hypothetical protein